MTEASLGLGDWSGSRGRENGGVRERLQWSHGFPFEKWESTREPGLVNLKQVIYYKLLTDTRQLPLPAQPRDPMRGDIVEEGSVAEKGEMTL